MTMLVGGQPGRIYTDTEVSQGKASLGQRLWVVDSQDGFPKEYVLCCVAASQNLVSGQVCTITGNFRVTVAAVAQGVTGRHPVGVAKTSRLETATATASASNYIWVQVYGLTSLLASTSILPNVALKIGTTAGQVTTRGTTSASAYIHGIVLTATSSTAGSIASAFLNYPQYVGELG